MQRFVDIVGKTIKRIEAVEGEDVVRFFFADGSAALLYHDEGYSEKVRLYEIVGNLDDLIGVPILKAEESTNDDDDPPESDYDSWTWTFYLLTTVKGHVTLRWLGESNGWYSEKVHFEQVQGASKP